MGLADQSIADVLDAVADGTPSPGGGAVAAIAGAAGAGLCEMTCRITPHNQEDPGADLATVADDLRAARTRLLALADEDAEAVAALVGDAEGNDPPDRAIAVPLETADLCLTVLGLADVAVEQGDGPAVDDAVTGALLAHAACTASVRNARVNLRETADADRPKQRRREADRLATTADDRLQAILGSVDEE